ncbi:MAG: gliding motility-associated C-terminal domain-containing protein [Cytophagaceae bacterium]
MKSIRAIILIVFALCSYQVFAVNYVVSSNADTDNGLAYNTPSAAENTLRKCIRLANSTDPAGTPHTITFNIAPGGQQTITLASSLQLLDNNTNGMSIDASTQPGVAAGQKGIILNGSGNIALQVISRSNVTIAGFQITNSVIGLQMAAGATGCTFSNNFIANTVNEGIQLHNSSGNTISNNLIRNVSVGINIVQSINNTISNNWLGTDDAGLNPSCTSCSVGILVIVTSPSNTITGNRIFRFNNGIEAKENSHNLTITNNVISGNTAYGIFMLGLNNTQIRGNIIGLSTTGVASATFRNNESGIGMHAACTNNTIGGLLASERNVISNNGGHGIQLLDGGSNNSIFNNYIGTDLTGTVKCGNVFSGIQLFNNCSGNTIGGNTVAHRNIISNNGGHGVQIDQNGDNNTITNNYIGTDVTGLLDHGNGFDGIDLDRGSDFNTIGGNGLGNIISANKIHGIYILGGSNDNVIYGNYFGVGQNGITSLGNGGNGVSILSSSRIIIGSTATGLSNLISGNGFTVDNGQKSGVSISGNSNDCVVSGNLIGLDLNGNALGNSDYGIWTYNNNNLTITNNITCSNGYGYLPGEGSGIALYSITGTVIIKGNVSGINPAGQARPNNNHGLILNNTNGAIVGGVTAAERNVFSGNRLNGVHIVDCNNTVVYNNYIGTNIAGTAAGNQQRGIYIWDTGGAPNLNNVIGGFAAGQANVIANNGTYGVEVQNNNTRNPLRGNTYYCNSSGGIKLTTGGNINIAAPVINGLSTKANVYGSGVPAGATVDLFYTDSTCHECHSGKVQGRTHIASVTANGSGQWSYTSGVGSLKITALVTDGNNNTSEFSDCPLCVPPVAPTGIRQDTTICAGASGNIILTVTGGGGGGSVLNWYAGSCGGGTPVATGNNVSVALPGSATTYFARWESPSCGNTTCLSFTINVNPVPAAPGLSQSGAVCGGPFFLQAENVEAGVQSFRWYRDNVLINGASSDNYEATQQGTYTVEAVRSGCFSEKSETQVVSFDPVPEAPSVSANSLTACANETITITAQSNEANITYVWYNSSGIIAGENSNTIQVNATGEYKVAVKKTTGFECLSPQSASLNVTFNPVPGKPSLQQSGPECGGPITLTATADANTNINWYRGADPIAGASGNTYSATVSGMYTIVAVLGNCASDASDAANVQISPVPQKPSISAASLVACQGQSIVLNAETNETDITYIWSNTSGVITDENAAQLTVNSSGSYTVTIRKTSAPNCESSASDPAVVNISPAPGKPSLQQSGQVCGGPITLTATADANTTINWYRGTDLISGASGNTYSATESGSYTIVAVIGNCISDASDPSNVQITPVPEKPSISAASLVACQGQSIVLNAETNETDITYIWSNASGVITDENAAQLTVSSSGSYTVTIRKTSAPNCESSASDPAVVNINPAPGKPSLQQSGPECGGPITLTATADANTTINWYRGADMISGVSGNTYSATESGTYTIVAVIGNCTSEVSDAANVQISPVPQKPEISAASLVACQGESIVLNAETNETDITYIWSNASGVIAGENAAQLTVNSSGSYMLMIRKTAAPNCESAASDPAVVNINPVPSAPALSATGPECGGPITITASGVAGAVYSWFESGNNLNVNGSSYTALSSGIFTVRQTVAGCTSDLSSVLSVIVKSVPSTPQIGVAGATSFCQGETVVMAVITNYSNPAYQWYKNGTAISGATERDFEASSEGQYSVSIQVDGCLSGLSQAIPVTAAPATTEPHAGSDKLTCSPTAILTGNNFAGDETASWSAVSSASITVLNPLAISVSDLAEGLNKFVWTISGRCGTKRDTVEVNVVSSTAEVSFASDADTVCAGAGIKLNAVVNHAAAPYKFIWTSSEGGAPDSVITNNNYLTLEFTASSSGPVVYSLVVIDNNNCRTEELKDTVEVLDRQELYIPNLITPNNDGRNDTFVIKDVNSMPIFSGATLDVFNRWGERVYKSKNYDNSWNAENIADGMYYYYLKTGCGSEEYKGWLHILANENN